VEYNVFKFQVYRTSRSNYMFMAVLLISFVSAAIAVGYSLAEVVPSRSCGPFKGDAPVWTTVFTAFSKLPEWIKNFALFLGTAGFTLPTIVILLLALYYYNAVTAANRQMVLVLRRQLVLEGHDKQFLLSRLSTIIKQQQHERSRNSQPNFNNLSLPPANEEEPADV
jgi:transmembrane channel-like protein